MKQQKNAGVILLKDMATSETLVADIYHDAESRERIFLDWVETGARFFRRDKQKYVDVAVCDYCTGRTDSFEQKSDKHIGFLMNNLVPARKVALSEWDYACRKEPNMTIDKLDSFIHEHQQLYSRFYWRTKGFRGILEEPEPLLEGEFCHARRVFEVRGNISFMGRDKIRNAEDVAWIFRQLEQKGIEHTFGVLTNKDDTVVIQIGIGHMTQTIVDTTALVVAAERFQAEKVWFVHNHPSGSVKASTADIITWDALHKALGDRLQEGIILNTDTGCYGIFSDREKLDFKFDETEQREVCELPLLHFDKLVLAEEYTRDRIGSHLDAAEYLSVMRFSKQPKLGMLVVNPNMEVMGNIFIHSSLRNLDKVAHEIVTKALPIGKGILLYTNKMKDKAYHQLEDLVAKRSCNVLRVMDVIRIQDELHFLSMADEGGLCANEEISTEPSRAVEVIPMKDGRGIVRIRQESGFLPGEIIRRNEMQRYAQGLLTGEELAKRYFPQCWLTQPDEERQQGFGWGR